MYRHGSAYHLDLSAPPIAAGDISTTAPAATTIGATTNNSTVTYNRDLAPIFFRECASCHRTGGPAPFNLLTYDDARHHARQIARVTSEKLMPPWLADPGCGDFVGERRLSMAQIASFKNWVEQGLPEGDANDLPARPIWVSDWELGPPDLILAPAKAYELPADGKGIYRNFVFSTPSDAPRYIRAVELRCDNPRVVHHTSLLIDRTGASHRRSERGGGSGFNGMDPGKDAYTPGGLNLSWQPGKPPCIRTEEEPWPLPGRADIVLQMHLRPSGKPELLQPQLGIYFSDKPPRTTPLLYRMSLRSTTIDIAPGSTDFTITSQYILPVDVHAVTVAAHAHYIGKQFRGWAVLPDGSEMPLLSISDWSFELQDLFTYRTPVALPRGSKICMKWVYDNSAGNAHNPNSPPRRIQYGDDSADEMGELWLQLRVNTPADYNTLAVDFAQRYLVPDAIERLHNLIRRNPADAGLHAELAVGMRQIGNRAEMNLELQKSLALDPECSGARWLSAQLLAEANNYPGAIEQYRHALKSEPDNAEIEADLGLALAIANHLAEGIEHLQNSLKLNPGDALTRTNLGRVYAIQGNLISAREELEKAMRLDPGQTLARESLNQLPKR